MDLDPTGSPSTDAALLIRHVLAPDGEDQVAFRSNQRYVLRLTHDEKRESRPARFAWRRDATYLITGGLGDVGLHVARSHGGARAFDA